MSGSVIDANFVDAIALPRIVWLRPNLIGLAFPLMKLLPARFIIPKALEEGVLEPGGLIAETAGYPSVFLTAMVLQSFALAVLILGVKEPPLRRQAVQEEPEGPGLG